MTRRMQRLLLNTVTRRAITIPVFIAGWLFATIMFPLAIPGLTILDLIARRKLTVVRAYLQSYIFITVEMIGLLIIAYLTLARAWWSHERWLQGHDWLQGWWASVQFEWARRIFRLRINVEGEEVLKEGSYIMFIRHVSVIDNLIPAVFSVAHNKVPMKYVLNWFLLRDPCIDIAGHRLGCAFVKGGTDQSSREITRIREMATDLRERQAVVIYPEGTLYSPDKYAKVMTRLERGRDEEFIAFARGLENTLPPRLGGTLALLELRPDLDVVFCSHAGLEDALDKTAIVAGGLIGRQLRIKFWRVRAADVPRERKDLRRWLFDEWSKVDAFVGSYER